MAVIYKKGGIALVILAAGASTRMKQIKQLLPWKNTTLLGNAIEQGLASNADAVFVVLGANYESIFKHINKTPITILNNLNWQSGMGESISYTIKHFIESKFFFDGVLITLADQPFVNYLYLNELIVNFKKNNLKHIISTNYSIKKGVPAIFPSSYFKKLSNLTEEFGAKKILNTDSDAIYSMNNKFVFFDIDTEEDYKEAINLSKINDS